MMTYVIGRDGRIVDAWYGYDSAGTRAAMKKLGLQGKRPRDPALPKAAP
jgi:hypothetical protein